MPNPHTVKTTHSALAALLCLGSLQCFGGPRTFARQQQQLRQQQSATASPDIERGVNLYRQGEMDGAVKAFRTAVKKKKDDLSAWLYLGQALMWQGDLKESLKAYKTALRLDPNFAAAHSSLAFLLVLSGSPRAGELEAARALELDANSIDAHYVVGLIRLREEAWLKALEKADIIIKINPNAAMAYSLKSQALFGLYERGNTILSDERRGAYDFSGETIEEVRAAQPLRIKGAAENLEKYLQLNPQAPDAAFQREQLEALRAYTQAGNPDTRIYSSNELSATTKAVILSKPEPGFSEAARRAGISGTVRLRAVLGADGKVRYIFVLKPLSYGLTERAIAAARGIKFKPATVNGSPVSQYVVLEYGFNIYLRQLVP
jgi:TonB family protein